MTSSNTETLKIVQCTLHGALAKSKGSELYVASCQHFSLEDTAWGKTYPQNFATLLPPKLGIAWLQGELCPESKLTSMPVLSSLLLHNCNSQLANKSCAGFL